jgi:hypothetical protein
MAQYQQGISALSLVISAIGLFAIGRTILIGMDRLAWLGFALFFFLISVVRRMILRTPTAAEASIRLRSASHWSELSPGRRRILRWFDWPLFIAIREREVQRIYEEVRFLIRFEANRVKLLPADELQSHPYFLGRIAQLIATYGLTVPDKAQGVLGPRFIEPILELEWNGPNRQVWHNLLRTLGSSPPLSPQMFKDALEASYVETLPPAERHKFYMDRR